MANKNRFFYRLPHEYRGASEFMSRVVIFLSLVILFLSLALAVRGVHGGVTPQYLSRDVLGRLIPLTAIQEVPGRNQAYLFLTDMLTQSFQFSSDNYEQRSLIISVYFNDAGLRGYQDVLSQLGVLNVETKFLLQTDFNANPVFDEETSGVYNGLRVFVYYVDLRHTVITDFDSRTIDKRYKIVLQQVPLAERSFALVVNSIRILVV